MRVSGKVVFVFGNQRTVEEQRIVFARVAHEPLHCVEDIQLCWQITRITRVVGQTDDITRTKA